MIRTSTSCGSPPAVPRQVDRGTPQPDRLARSRSDRAASSSTRARSISKFWLLAARHTGTITSYVPQMASSSSGEMNQKLAVGVVHVARPIETGALKRTRLTTSSSKKPLGKRARAQTSIDDPIATVRSLGRWKLSIGLAALRAIATNSFFCQPRRSVGSSVVTSVILETK
jgi:hypothetical protein